MEVVVPRLAYGESWIEDYLSTDVLAEGRLVPLSRPAGCEEIANVNSALEQALTVSSELVPSLAEWMGWRYRGGDIAILVDDYTRPSTRGGSSPGCWNGSEPIESRGRELQS